MLFTGVLGARGLLRQALPSLACAECWMRENSTSGCGHRYIACTLLSVADAKKAWTLHSESTNLLLFLD